MSDKMNWNYSPTEEELEMLRNSPKKPRASIKPRDQWNDEDWDKYHRFMTKFAKSKLKPDKKVDKVEKNSKMHDVEYLKRYLKKNL